MRACLYVCSAVVLCGGGGGGDGGCDDVIDVFIGTNSINGIRNKKKNKMNRITFGSALLKQAFKLNARSQPAPAGYRHFRIM